MHNNYKKIIWLLLSVVLIYAPIVRGAVRTWSITPVLLVELVLIFLWLFKSANSPSQIRPSELTTYNLQLTTFSIDLPILIFTVIAAISFFFSIYKYDSFYAFLRLLGYVGVYYVIFYEFDKSMTRRILYLVITLGSCLSLYGLLQYFGILNHSWWFPRNFLSATYVNHNHFAGYLELVIPVGVAQLFNQFLRYREKAAGKNHMVLLTSGVIFMIAAFILSQSRGAWVSLCISLIVLASSFAKKEKIGINYWIALGLVLIIMFSFIYLGRETIAYRFNPSDLKAAYGNDLFDRTRLMIWNGSIDMIIHNTLIGTGIGTFVWGFPRYRPEGLAAQANAAHNDYLQMAAEMGVLAPILMMWIFFIIVKRGFTKNDPSFLSIGCATGVLSLAIHGLVDFNFHIPANMLLFTVYAGIIMGKND
jgi:O-antigen ligase